MAGFLVTVAFFVIGIFIMRNINPTENIKIDKTKYYLAKEEFKKISFEGQCVDFNNVKSNDLNSTSFYYKNCEYLEIKLDSTYNITNVAPYYWFQNNKLDLLFSKENGLGLHNGNTQYSLYIGMRVFKKSGDSNIYFRDKDTTYAVPFLLFLDIEQ